MQRYLKGTGLFWGSLMYFTEVVYLHILSLISLFLDLMASAVRDFLPDDVLFLLLKNDLDFLTAGVASPSFDLVLVPEVSFAHVSQLLFTLGKVNLFLWSDFLKWPLITWSDTAGSWSRFCSCSVPDFGAVTGAGSRSRWVHVSPFVAGLSFIGQFPCDSRRWNTVPAGWLVDILLKCLQFPPDVTGVFCIVVPSDGIPPDSSPDGTTMFCALFSPDGSAVFDAHLTPGVAWVLLAEVAPGGLRFGSGVVWWPWPWSDLEGQTGLWTSGPLCRPILRASIWK